MRYLGVMVLAGFVAAGPADNEPPLDCVELGGSCKKDACCPGLPAYSQVFNQFDSQGRITKTTELCTCGRMSDPPEVKCDLDKIRLMVAPQSVGEMKTVIASTTPERGDDCDTVKDGTEIRFSVRDPDNTGSTVTPTVATTQDGLARVGLQAGPRGGTITVRATSPDCAICSASEEVFISDDVFRVVGTVGMNDAKMVERSGDRLYVADGDGGLKIVEAATRAVVGDIDLTPQGPAEGVTVVGTLAYLTNRDSLRVCDVQNPATARTIDNFQTDGRAAAVAVAGGVAYVADGSNGLVIIGVSNPLNMQQLGRYDGRNTRGVFHDNGVVYISDSVTGHVEALDVSNPAQPTQISTLEVAKDALRIDLVGALLFVAGGFDGLKIVDVSDPANPAVIGAAETPTYAWDVAVAGDFAFVTVHGLGSSAPGKLIIFDITDPTAPKQVGEIETAGPARGVEAVGNDVYVADGEMGLIVIEVVHL